MWEVLVVSRVLKSKIGLKHDLCSPSRGTQHRLAISVSFHVLHWDFELPEELRFPVLLLVFSVLKK